MFDRALALPEMESLRRGAFEDEARDSGGLDPVDSAREWVRFEDEEASLGLDPRTEAEGLIVADASELKVAG